MNELTIKYADINLLVQGAKEITLNPKGEEILIQLLDLQNAVETALRQAKVTIAIAMSEIDPDLTSVSSNTIKIMNRVYGAKYRLDTNLIKDMDSKFVKETISYAPDSYAIDQELKVTGNIPLGVNFVERNKTVSITKKGDKLSTIE